MSTEINFGGGIALITQVALLVLHYGNSNVLGVHWGTLPWWIVWFPLLLVVIVIVISIVVILIIAALS